MRAKRARRASPQWLWRTRRGTRRAREGARRSRRRNRSRLLRGLKNLRLPCFSFLLPLFSAFGPFFALFDGYNCWELNNLMSPSLGWFWWGYWHPCQNCARVGWWEWKRDEILFHHVSKSLSELGQTCLFKLVAHKIIWADAPDLALAVASQQRLTNVLNVKKYTLHSCVL